MPYREVMANDGTSAHTAGSVLGGVFDGVGNGVDALRDGLGDSIRTLIAGDNAPPDERFSGPREDNGYFGPDSAIWQVHGDLSMLIGGLRALLLQTMHPLTMAGVADHSDYRSDPLGRLHRTGDFVGTTTFGTKKEADRSIRVVKKIHKRVEGTTPDGRPYSATDPHLLAWVHATEADSFLRAYRRFGAGDLSDARADEYVANMSVVASKLGVKSPPTTVEELRDELIAFRPELEVGQQAREAVRFLVLPPLPVATLGPYGIIGAAAVGLLPRFARWQLRLPRGPISEPLVVRPAARALIRSLGWVLGRPDFDALARQAG